MKKIKLEISGLSYSQTQAGAYALVLSEVDGNRTLPIIIGSFEAQAIALELEKMKPSRPLTHDLFKTFADAFSMKVTEVVIHSLKEGVFHSKLVCEDGVKEVEIDARTSDAIAIAVRFNCAIYTYDSILSSSGIILSDDEVKPKKTKKKTEPVVITENPETYTGMSLAKLKKQLKSALDNEDYEKACLIRDQIAQQKDK